MNNEDKQELRDIRAAETVKNNTEDCDQLLEKMKEYIASLKKPNSATDPLRPALLYFERGYRAEKLENNVYNLTYDDGTKSRIFDPFRETPFIIADNVLDLLCNICYHYDDRAASTKCFYNTLRAARDFRIGMDFKIENRTETFDKLLSYNNAFYARVKGTNDMIRITQNQATYAVFDSYYNLKSLNQVKEILSIIQENKDELPHIPDYIFRPAKPRDNGLRFNKTAYRLIHYYLREASIKNKHKYIITIMSKGNMGKSTFSNFLKYLFKNEYYSADSKYTNQFSSSFYASSRLTVFNDCSNEYLANSHVLKQVSGGDDMQIEAKGKQGYSGYIDAYLLFIGNEDLRYNILDSGLLNRFVNMPWDDTVIKEHYTPDFGYEEVEPVKDLKWLNYEWTDDEIAFQIELADKLYEYDLKDKLDLQKLCDKTVAKVYLNHPAIRRSNDFISFLKYCEDNHIKMHWSEENYNQYLYGIEDYINKGIITREEVEKAREYKALSVQNLLGVKAVSPIAED